MAGPLRSRYLHPTILTRRNAATQKDLQTCAHDAQKLQSKTLTRLCGRKPSRTDCHSGLVPAAAGHKGLGYPRSSQLAPQTR